MFEYDGIKIKWHGHDTFSIKSDKMIVTDPYKLSKNMDADIVLISHNHFDHLSIDDLKKVISSETVIVAAKECIDTLQGVSCRKIIGLEPGREETVDEIKIKAIHAYNLNKINPDTKKPFHPKEDNKIGFFITINGKTLYHTGDSDPIPAMSDLKPDILFVPVSGTYVMTSTEAAEAVAKIKPKIAIPMHYGTIVGSQSDAVEFKNKVTSCKVEILTKE